MALTKTHTTQQYGSPDYLWECLTGADLPFVEKQDELSLLIASDNIHQLQGELSFNTRFRSQDARNQDGTVGFIPFSPDQLLKFVDYQILQSSIVVPRSKIEESTHPGSRIEKPKLVSVVFAKCGPWVMLVPRGTKKILPDVHTLTVMESLVFDDIRRFIYKRKSHKRCRQPLQILLDSLSERGIYEECPELVDLPITWSGIVGGLTSDIGLVSGIEIQHVGALEEIAERYGGTIFDSRRYHYENVAHHYGGRVDGWSDSILKHIYSKTFINTRQWIR